MEAILDASKVAMATTGGKVVQFMNLMQRVVSTVLMCSFNCLGGIVITTAPAGLVCCSTYRQLPPLAQLVLMK